MHELFFAQTFGTPPGVRDIPAKFTGHPRLISSKSKEDKLSREGTNFSATTPSHGRPPPHRAVSRPQKLIFVLFFLAWYKLHTGWFINRTPGEFINWGICIKFKGLLCGSPTYSVESLMLNFWPQAIYKSNPGTVIVFRKRGPSEQTKIQYIKYLHCQWISLRCSFPPP